MEQMTATDFSSVARTLTLSARNAGLRTPAFRSPPRNGRQRSVRRYRDGSTMVSVVVHGRTRQSVIEDMIEGVVVANALSGNVAAAARRTLWHGFRQEPSRAA